MHGDDTRDNFDDPSELVDSVVQDVELDGEFSMVLLDLVDDRV